MNDIGNSPAARDIRNLIHPYTNLDLHRTKGPLIIEKGKGVRVWDDEARNISRAWRACGARPSVSARRS